MSAIRVLTVPTTGGSDVLTITETPSPEPGPDQLLVEVAAAGVNFIDVYFREGRYPRPLPFVVGDEGAGRVSAVGTDVAGFEIGDAVAWASGSTGSMAERTSVTASHAVPVPDGVGLDVAAAAMLQGMTAQYLVTSTYPVGPGDAVLVHAAAGGVGQLLVQLAKGRGATVVATVSTGAKADIASDRGADTVIVYPAEPDTAALAAQVRAATRGRGVDVVFDGVGAATFEASLAALAPRGMLVLFGAASGPVPPFDLQRLNPAGSLFVTRPTLAHYIATREELLWRAQEVLTAIADGALSVAIGGRYPLADAARAYDDLEGRRSTGKLLVIP